MWMRFISRKFEDICSQDSDPEMLDGVGGIRTPTERVKSSMCDHYTTTPIGRGGAFIGIVDSHQGIFTIESRRIGCGTTPNERIGKVRIELTSSCAQDTRAAGALHPE